jgi:hypothetical protein
MALATDKLVPYVAPAYPAIEGGEARFLATELRKISQSIASIEQILATVDGTGSTALQKANNLSDLTDINLAKANLALATVATSGAYSDLSGLPSLGTVASHDDSEYVHAANNGSDFANAATVRSNLGLAIGTDVLAFDAQLTSNIRQNNQNGNYTTQASDAEKHLYYNSGAGPYTWTIAANASVAYPVGTTISFVNLAGGPTIAIAIGGTDTLYWAGTGLAGTRTLANYGVATAIKFNSVGWIISGAGLS